jgi:hypothetical protein
VNESRSTTNPALGLMLVFLVVLLSPILFDVVTPVLTP